MSKKNLLYLTDSYKLTHWKQYPPDTKTVYSYFESRGGMFTKTLFFGLQYYLKEYLQNWTIKGLDNIPAHFGRDDCINIEGMKALKELGYLPVSIKAVPEGTLVETNNVLVTIENTDPRFYWLPNFLETMLVELWYPTTVATLSYFMKNMITKYLEFTGDPAGIDFKLHDFGFRGVSSVESASIGGAAHLINFMGTDTLAAIPFIQDYYNTDQMPGFSIPASEHSTMTSWGNETLAMRNMLEQYPTGLIACVSDSYDIYNACENIWGDILKDKVLARDGGLVVRPDSGHPPEVVVKVLEALGSKFGYEVNDKGYKVLPPQVRVIQGDGIDHEMTGEILEAMRGTGWAVDNVAFGMGGALLQKINRDTQKFAFKCSAIERATGWHDVFKQPVTDPGKNSKRGRLSLVRTQDPLNTTGSHSLTTVPQSETSAKYDQLVEVFRDGKILKEYTFEEVREASRK